VGHIASPPTRNAYLGQNLITLFQDDDLLAWQMIGQLDGGKETRSASSDDHGRAVT
jgi:hypothetical protein